MAEAQTKVGFFGRLKRSVYVASTGGMIGYMFTTFFLVPLPQTVVVAACCLSGAVVAKVTGKKKK